jgi:hypothetical protein
VECKNRADLFLTSLANYDKRYKVRGKAVDGWAMTEKHTTEYGADPESSTFALSSKPRTGGTTERGVLRPVDGAQNTMHSVHIRTIIRAKPDPKSLDTRGCIVEVKKGNPGF